MAWTWYMVWYNMVWYYGMWYGKIWYGIWCGIIYGIYAYAIVHVWCIY